MTDSKLTNGLLMAALICGCSDAGSGPGELDPLELSAYLFAGEADATIVHADPDDPERTVTWEIRDLPRIQSFLVKSCADSENSACRYLLLGYTDYRLDGSIEVVMSFPTLAPGGVRGEPDEFADKTKACRFIYDPASGYLNRYESLCPPEAADTLLALFDQFQPPPPLESLSAECYPIVTATVICLLSHNPYCKLKAANLGVWQAMKNCPEAKTWLEIMACSSHDKKGCFQGELWWFDSCDLPDDRIRECPSGCYQDECLEEIQTHSLEKCNQHDLIGTLTRVDDCTLEARGITNASSPAGRLDRYACTRSGKNAYLDESGPEIIYPYFAEKDGYIDVTLTHESTKPGGKTGDLDLFLLRDNCNAQDCIQHGSSGIFAEVEQGNYYYIVVDGYEGSHGSHEISITDPYCPRRTACEGKTCGDACQWQARGLDFDGYCSHEGMCVPPTEFDFCLDWVPSEPAGVDFTRSEVTVGQYKQCVDAKKCPPPEVSASVRCHYQEPEEKANYPVNCVTWDFAREFCDWIQGRLPTQEEWYAEASDNGKRRYPWGDDEPTCDHVVWDGAATDPQGCGFSSAEPVCSKEKGNSVSGLCDMSASLWEWTSTPAPSTWVACGGSSASNMTETLQATSIAHLNPDTVMWTMGFRCVRDPR